MPKIIDSFLFFQELDILDIRLEYLDDYVDKFIIVEACQTFSGKRKNFIFEENARRYEKYADKICYYKIEDYHVDYLSIKDFLSTSRTSSRKKILGFLERHRHYNKSDFRWVCDSYHRECIHLVLDNVADPEDIVIVSDIDEIPSSIIFDEKNLVLASTAPRVCKQKEFRYYLNYYNNSDWFGSIVGKYKILSGNSLNELRIDSKKSRNVIHPEPIDDGGYHFTSCGNIETIKNKINSWAHQEFNNSTIIKNLNENILTGQDIFQRKTGTNLIRVEVSNRTYFDEKMEKIILKYPLLISYKEIHNIQPTFYRAIKRFITMAFLRMKYEVKKLLNK